MLVIDCSAGWSVCVYAVVGVGLLVIAAGMALLVGYLVGVDSIARLKEWREGE